MNNFIIHHSLIKNSLKIEEFKRKKFRISVHKSLFPEKIIDVKMNLPNDSVIIIESPIQKNEKEKCTNPPKKKIRRESLRNGAMKSQIVSINEECRSPLKTVYQSVVGHQSNEIRCRPQSPGIKKRLRSSTTPNMPNKRRKCENPEIDGTIILSDDDESKKVPKIINTSDIVCLTDLTPKPSKSQSKNHRKKVKRRKKIAAARAKQREESKLSESDKNCHEEDLEIVWSSAGAPESTSTADNERRNEQKNENVKDKLFFVDTTGDASLLLLDSLILDDKEDVNTHKEPKKKNNEQKNEKKEKNNEQKIEKGEKNTEQKIEKVEKNNEQKIEKEKKASRWNPLRLREIVVDGCNVAMQHVPNQGFSEQGLKLVLDYFVQRGHKVTIFLPQNKRTRDRQLLEKWYRESIVVFTPSRKVGKKMITPYDDRFILDYATKCEGVVISSDQYRDLWGEKPEWRETIEKRLLAPTFVGDYVMFPEDPLGRSGPKLDEFLRLS